MGTSFVKWQNPTESELLTQAFSGLRRSWVHERPPGGSSMAPGVRVQVAWRSARRCPRSLPARPKPACIRSREPPSFARSLRGGMPASRPLARWRAAALPPVASQPHQDRPARGSFGRSLRGGIPASRPLARGRAAALPSGRFAAASGPAARGSFGRSLRGGIPASPPLARWRAAALPPVASQPHQDRPLAVRSVARCEAGCLPRGHSLAGELLRSLHSRFIRSLPWRDGRGQNPNLNTNCAVAAARIRNSSTTMAIVVPGLIHGSPGSARPRRLPAPA